MEAEFQPTPTGTSDTGADGPDYNFSVPFDQGKTSDSPVVASLAAHVLEVIQPVVPTYVGPQFQDNLALILLNLYSAWATHPLLFVAYSRDKAAYIKQRASYSKVKDITNALIDLELVDNAKGFLNRQTNKGWLSRMRATPTLQAMFRDHDLKTSMVQSVETDRIILRDGKGRDIAVPDTVEVKIMRRTLQRINHALQAMEVTLDLTEEEREEIIKHKDDEPGKVDRPIFDLTRRTLHRVFNQRRMDRGGRFYGHFVQSVPKKYRSRVRINGEPVCELDYSALAVNMLYAREGLPLPGDDAYCYEEFPIKLMKRVTFRLINAKDRKAATLAVLKLMKWKEPENIADLLIQHMAEKHAPIAQHFCSGVGVALQYRDSRIAEAVMLDLLRQGIPCIPIHDSFLVPVSHEEELGEAMDKASAQVMGQALPWSKASWME